MKILCIGSATKDIFFPTNEGVVIETPEDLLSQRKIAFEMGAKYHIESRFESLGGCSVNVAVGLSRLGENVSCYASIGDDMIAEWIKEKLISNRIGIANIEKQVKCQNDLSAILVDINSGERVIFSNQTSNKFLKIEKEKLLGFDWIFIGDLSGDWKKNSDLIVEYAKEKNIPFAINPRQKTIHDDAKKVMEAASCAQVLFCNKDEAIELVKSYTNKGEFNDEKFLLKSLKDKGAALVVITDGTRGAWANDGHEMLHVDVDSFLRKAVDTTGAGDAFTSGFFAAYLKGKEVGECLKWGIINSSSSVQYYGGIEGLLKENEIEKMLEKVSVFSI